MARTAVINRRRRAPKRRRRNYGAAAANPRRRRRRRNYGAAAANPRRRRSYRRGRRRNPATPYSSGGYRRTPNPGLFDFHDLLHVVPAGAAGIWGARFALKQSGAFGPDGPGIAQAIAIWVGAHLSGALMGSMFGAEKGAYAKIGALAYGGDLFARTVLFAKSAWVNEYLSLAGDDDTDEQDQSDDSTIEGFQDQSALGDWALSGMGAPGELVRDAQGNLYQLSGMGLDSGPGAGSRLAGFQDQSALGSLGQVRVNPNSNTSFGYSP